MTMEHTQTDSPPFIGSFLIVGCGISGLSAALTIAQAGHKVIVFERANELREIGAGVQLSPNATRLLQQWGFLDEIRRNATQPETGTLRSYRGEVLSRAPPGSAIEKLYQVPYLVIHRARLLQVLEQAALQNHVDIRLGCEVVDIDFQEATVRLENGELYSGDAVFGADGEKSVCRSLLLRTNDPPIKTGNIVYRIVAKRTNIHPDNPAAELVKTASVHLWLGPKAHAVSYLLRDNFLNVVVVRASPHEADAAPEVLPASTGAQPADLEELRLAFAGWDPALQELLNVQDRQCTKWTLFEIDELDSWKHNAGKFILIGDAAHAVQPYLAQGALQALEDAAALGTIFKNLSQREDIPLALSVFEAMRLPRVRDIRLRSFAQKQMYELSDGSSQQDGDMRLSSDDKTISPNILDDPVFRDWLWGYDAAAHAAEEWAKAVVVTQDNA